MAPYFLQNLFQPDNCPRHYVGTAPHHTSQKYQQTDITQKIPPLPSSTAAKTMSASEASDNDLTQYAPGHMPMPDFEALARDIQNTTRRRRRPGTFGNFLGQACSSSKEYECCLTGTPSSQRLAAQSTSMARYVPFCCNVPLPFLLSMVYSFIGFVICGQHC